MDGKTQICPLDMNVIQKCLPHRYPFLLIDRVTSFVPKDSLAAIKNISISDPIFQGHFPGNPVYPGVLMIEAMAQASAILGHYSKEEPYQAVLLTEISQARFRRKVIPGDVLEISIVIDRSRDPFFWFKGEARVDGDLASKAVISALMK